jgi:putative hydrolase of the HAD superfamily
MGFSIVCHECGYSLYHGRDMIQFYKLRREITNNNYECPLFIMSETKMLDKKLISFDLDGTLTDSSFVDSVWLKGIPKLYSIKNKVTFDFAKKAVKEEYDKVGEMKLQWYDINYWIKYFDIDTNWKDLFFSYKNEIRTYPDVNKILEELTKKGKRLIIISNASTEFLEFQLANIKIGGYFEAIFSATSDFGLTKKTADLYQKVCNKLKIFPNEMIHIGDDRKFDFDVPRKLGVLAFHLDRSGTQKGEFVFHNLEEFQKTILAE